MEHVPFNGNEAEQQALQIFTALNTIHERFVQHQADAAKAKRSLSTQKYLTSTQCKRATKPLFELDHPINDLYTLLRQRPLPANLGLQLHRITLTLQQLETQKEDLQSYI